MEKGIEAQSQYLFENKIAPLFFNASNLVLKAEN